MGVSRTTAWVTLAPPPQLHQLASHQRTCCCLLRDAGLQDVSPHTCRCCDHRVEAAARGRLEEKIVKALRLTVEANDMCAAMGQDVVFQVRCMGAIVQASTRCTNLVCTRTPGTSDSASGWLWCCGTLLRGLGAPSYPARTNRGPDCVKAATRRSFRASCDIHAWAPPILHSHAVP